MPSKPKRPCGQAGCRELTNNAYCDRHRRQREQWRESSASRGYGGRWRVARAAFLHQHPLCVICERENKLTPATEVDHIIPHRGDTELFWDKSNWQALCKPCHSRKTASGR